MQFNSLAFRWLILAVSVQTVFSKPVETPIDAQQMKYLEIFGYFEQGIDENPFSLMSINDLHYQAIRRLQENGNITVTGMMDAATKQLMEKPRCGYPDYPNSATNNADQRRTKRQIPYDGPKWKHNNLKWSLRKSLENVDIKRIRSELRRAFQVWSRHSLLTFEEVDDSRYNRADIVVSFEKGNHSPKNYNCTFETPSTLAHAYFPHTVLKGIVHFNKELKWSLTNQDSTEFSVFSTAAHEIGHSLGLPHRFNDSSSIMYQFYQYRESNFELSRQDQYNIQNIYGPKREEPVYTTTTPKLPAKTTKSGSARTTKYTSSTTTTETPPPSRQPQATDAEHPDFCDTSFDSVSIIRRETYFFKGEYMWRFNPEGILHVGFPAKISRMWKHVNQVDAAYEKQDGRIVFFSGRHYHEYDGTVAVEGNPKPLTTLGLPERLERVDAVWNLDEKTYIFSGSSYWKCDGQTTMEPCYSQDMSAQWRGLGYNINGAIQLHGAMYFFKNRVFRKFDHREMSVEQNETRLIGEFYQSNCNATDSGGGWGPNNLSTNTSNSTPPLSVVWWFVGAAVLLLTIIIVIYLWRRSMCESNFTTKKSKVIKVGYLGPAIY